MFDTFDDASTIFDGTGSLGPFLETRIDEAREKESLKNSVDATSIPETPVAKESCLEERYIELDDEFYEDYLACSKSADPDAMKKLLEKHAMKNKFTPDPKFATSPISIKDVDFKFSVELSYISIAESDSFHDKENEDAIAHLQKLTDLSSLFSNVEKI